MCKLFVMTNTKKIEPKKMELIVKKAAKVMGKTEKDGFGISIRGSKGIFNRRFLKPEHASIFEKYSSLPFLKPSMNEDGNLGTIDAMILHGRTSTNQGGLINSHPISKHGFHVCHNGVVEDSGEKYTMKTQNDTEHIAERFSKGISEVEKHISGYYAFATFQDNTENLFIVKDSIASLYFAEIPELECHVFATTKDLISSVLKEVKINHLPIECLKDNTFLEYLGPELIRQTDITPKGRTVYTDSLASKSLGYSLSNEDDTDLKRDFTTGFSSSELEDYNYRKDYLYFDSEDEFLDEVEQLADNSWSFFYGKYSYTYEEFLELEDFEKLKCTVIRADGTICSPDSKLNGSLFDGNAS